MRVPFCEVCHKCMVFTFAFPYMEYACLDCDTAEEFCCEKFEVDEKEHDDKKELWGDDLHAIAVKNGARCALDICSICSDLDNYKFKYYKQNVRTTK